MIAIRTIFILLIVVSCSSCTKDKGRPLSPVIISPVPIKYTPVYDTIHPNSYLPVYPGSWWKYVNENNDTIIESTSKTYKLDWYSYYTTKLYRSDTFFVPYYNNAAIWGYRANHGPQAYPNEHPLKLIVTDSLPVGSAWQSRKMDSHGGTYSRIKTKDTSIVVLGITYYPTIMVELYDYYNTMTFPADQWNYYTRDIGLVKTEGKIRKDLVSYSINK